MKIFYFIFFKDRFIISFEGEHQILWLLITHDMHVNDDYASHITSKAILEIVWVILEHLKQTLQFDASKSFLSFFLSHDQ